MERFNLLIKNFDSLSQELVTIREQIKNEKDEFFNSIVEFSPNFIAIIQNGKYMFANAKALDILKCRSSSEIIGNKILNTVHPEYQDVVTNQLRVSQNTSERPVLIKLICKDDSQCDFESNSAPFLYNKKPATLIIGRDITEELKQKDKIKQEQELRAEILNSFKEVVALYEPDHQIKWINNAGKQQLGITDDSYIGKYCHNVWFGSDKPCPTCPVINKNDKHHERVLHFSDKTIWMVRNIPMLNDEKEIVGYIEFRENITEKEKIRKELEESHIRLDKAELTTSLGHFELDLFSNNNVFSKGALKILGFNKDQYTNNRNIDILKYVHPDDEDRIKYYLNRSMLENEKFNQVFKILDSSGKTKTVHGKAETIIDTKKNRRVLFFTIQDISQIQRLKRQIANDEDRYKLLAENSPVGVGMIYKGELVYVNKTLLTVLGFNSTNEFRLTDIFLHVSPTNIFTLKEIADEIKNKTAVYPIRNQIKFTRKDGNQCVLNLILTECIIYDKTYIQSIVIDMTKEYEIEKKNKQLAVDSLYVNQKNKILHEIEIELNQILNNKKKLAKSDFNSIYSIINSYGKFDKDWEILKSHFEEIHSSFFHKLKTEYPLLTTIDLKHCACIKLNFTTKEIARFFNIKASSVQISRVRLKKKMNLLDSIDLRAHILSF